MKKLPIALCAKRTLYNNNGLFRAIVIKRSYCWRCDLQAVVTCSPSKKKSHRLKGELLSEVHLNWKTKQEKRVLPVHTTDIVLSPHFCLEAFVSDMGKYERKSFPNSLVPIMFCAQPYENNGKLTLRVCLVFESQH